MFVDEELHYPVVRYCIFECIYCIFFFQIHNHRTMKSHKVDPLHLSGPLGQLALGSQASPIGHENCQNCAKDNTNKVI